MKAKAKKEQSPDNKRYVSWFWRLWIILILAVPSVFLLAGLGVLGEMPDHTKLENPDSDLATQVYSADGKLLGKFFTENRTPVEFKDLPPHLVDALVSTEDERFYEHSGIDLYGTGRAVAFLGKKGGASTITQQLAKNYFTKGSKSLPERIIQKIQEWVIAVRLERQYTKEEIIAMYLNQFDFLYNAKGIHSASRIYFNKLPSELNVEESAVLVAMLKNPRAYNPRRDLSKENALNRRNTVFNQMVRNDKLTATQADSLKQTQIVLDITTESHNEGLAPYFRGYLSDWMKKWASENINPDTGKNYSLYTDGLKINTTVDSRMQAYAEQAVEAHMKNLQKEFDKQNRGNSRAPFRRISSKEREAIISAAIKRTDRWRQMKAEGKSEKDILASFDTKTDMVVFDWNAENYERDTIMTPRDSILYYKKFLRTGMISLDPQTGFVKAWVGGIKHSHFKYDHVQQGRRQAGSTFKPFVYATAIDLLHYSPCKVYSQGRITIPAGRHGAVSAWSPDNSDGKYGGSRNLIGALAHSVNTISAKLINETGPRAVVDMSERLGLDTSNYEVVPSLALGSADVSVYEMTSAYGVFANQGVLNEPVVVTSIEDKNGRVVYNFTPQTKDVLNPETAYVVTQLMKGVTEEGSGARLRGAGATGDYYYKSVVTGYPYNFDNEIAGKTGTTQNNSDGWFIGMVPNLVTGVWAGGEDRATHFASTRYGQGATMALPIWGSYMKAVYKNPELGISKEPFAKPEELSIEVDCAKYREVGGGGGSGFGGYGDEDNVGDDLDM